MRAVQALDPPVGLRVRHPRWYIGEATSLHQGTPLRRKKLAAVVVNHIGFPRHSLGQALQSLLHGESYRVRSHGGVEAPVDQEAAVTIENIHQIVPAWPDEQIHQ